MASLRDLGLSEYEARAYRTLLTGGPSTAKELSRASDVPMGRIYDVLNSLEAQNLVRSQSASRPKKYVAVEPETALDRLLEDKKRELRERADQYESIVDDLVGELETTDPVEETFWTAAVGPEATVDLLLERIAAADERIVMVASTLSPQFDAGDVGDRATAELHRALDRGVEVSLLMRPDLAPQLPESIGEFYRETLAPYEGFTVRTDEDIRTTFTVVDDVEVCIEVPHPMAAERTFALIDFKDREFATSVTNELEPRWASAERFRL